MKILLQLLLSSLFFSINVSAQVFPDYASGHCAGDAGDGYQCSPLQSEFRTSHPIDYAYLEDRCHKAASKPRVSNYESYFVACLKKSRSTAWYSSSCELKDGNSIIISVSNKLMIVDKKWKAFYTNKSQDGLYLFENKGYSYKVGNYFSREFPITVTNKYQDETVSGTCHLK